MMSSFDSAAAQQRRHCPVSGSRLLLRVAFAASLGIMALPQCMRAQSPAPVMPSTQPPPTPPRTAAQSPGPGNPAHNPVAEDPAKDPNDRVKLSVTKMGVSERGQIVFAVRIQARSNKDLVLGIPATKPGANDKPFTMEGCVLENVATGRKTKAINDLPGKPYYGPMSLLAGVQHGEWIELGVAFPKLPPPPPENQGKPVAYKLTVPIAGSDPAMVNIPEDILLGKSKGTP
jgi:hypothetical protein